ncbi:MAG: cation transporter dimerization domain-containing protein, partial [Myxococcota bacterium]
QSPAILADGVHIRADAITSVGVAAGMAATLLTGFAWLDAVVALTVGVWLFTSGVAVVREAVGGLMDEADPELLSEIADVLSSVRRPGWVAPHHGKVHRLGRTIHIDLHMVFPAYWTIERVHDDASVMERALVDAFGPGSEVMLHMESCTSRSCSYCDAVDCPIRQVPLVRTLPWTGAHIASRARPSPLPEDSGGAPLDPRE